MKYRLTKLQKEALIGMRGHDWHAYGGGYGRHRVAIRALRYRHPELMDCKCEDGEEFYHLTAAGRELANSLFSSHDQLAKP